MRAIREREAVVHPVVHDGTHRREHVQPGVHARLRQTLEQFCGATQPSSAHRRGETAEGLVAEVERDSGGIGRAVRRHVGGKRPLLKIGGFLRPAGPPRGVAHQLQVVGRKGVLPEPSDAAIFVSSLLPFG